MTNFFKAYGALPPQQRRITYWLCMGLSNKEIAEQLHINVRTVGNQLSAIYKSLDVKTRSELIATFYQESDKSDARASKHNGGTRTGTEAKSNG